MPLLINKNNKFLLYTGEITFRKAKLNGLKKINCNIREGIDKSRLEELNLSEIYFSGLKLPTEIAKDFMNYRKRKNMSQQVLSRRTKITPGSIHHYESLLKKLDPKLANELDQGKLTFKEARCIADLDDFDIQNKVAKPFIEGKISSVYIEKIVSLIKKNNYTQNLEKIIEDIISGTYIFNNKVEKKIPYILKILGVDPLISIPLSVPLKGPGIVITPKEFVKAIKKITKSREDDFGEIESKNVLEGKTVSEEFNVIKTENKKNETKGLSTESIGILMPDSTDVDETKIYDQDLINNLKSKFKEWKTGWKEQHVFSGDEFDDEVYVEGYEQPFITDFKKSIKSRIVILLDHSSSIADQQMDYKKATLALLSLIHI